MPVADIEAIAHAQRMMTTRRGPVVPRIGFSPGLPLARDPPPPDLDRAGGIGEIEDHHDVADIALGRRRQVGVAAIEIVAVHTAAGRAPLGDQLRRAGARDVIDPDAPAELGRSALAQPLVVDDHDAVRHPHLVGMPALRQIDGRELARLARIGHVHDRGAARPAHVADKERRALDPNLPSARAVEVRYQRGVGSTRHKTLDQVTFIGAGYRHCAVGPGALELRRFSRYCRRRRGPTS